MLETVTIRNLAIGEGSVDALVRRSGGSVAVHIFRRTGGAEVVVRL